MNAAFVFQLGIDFVALNRRDYFLYAAEVRRRALEDLHFPAERFRVTRIHAEELACEEGGFVAAGPGANLHDDAFLVVRIFRQEEQL